MSAAAEKLFALLRAALHERMADAALFANCEVAEWRDIYRLSSEQGVLAQAWDGMKLLPEAVWPPQEMRLQWAFNVDRIEKRYHKQEKIIARLAAFYQEHDIPMMLLKGHGLSLFYPVPEHRPCGDIDIWLFGKQDEADKLIAREWGISVDEDKEHHTTFDIDGIMVENHYDLVNTQTHASNRWIESLLKQYAAQPGNSVTIAGVPVFMPSEQFNALFILRHTGAHFAAARIGLRHLIDWFSIVKHSRGRIDWEALYAVAQKAHMQDFLNCLNAICIDHLGLDAALFPAFLRNAELENRVLNEILSPEFPQDVPSGLLRAVWFKTRRWWAHRWKHCMVYDEALTGAFFHSVWAHLKRPKSIA